MCYYYLATYVLTITEKCNHNHKCNCSCNIQIELYLVLICNCKLSYIMHITTLCWFGTYVHIRIMQVYSICTYIAIRTYIPYKYLLLTLILCSSSSCM